VYPLGDAQFFDKASRAIIIIEARWQMNFLNLFPIKGNMRKRKILIVDDNESLLATLALFLGQSDLEVETANNIEDALYKLAGGNFDILLLDLGVSNRSGEEVLYFLGISLRPAPKIIVVMTAVAEEIEKSVFRDTISGVLEKPFQFEDLLREIEKHS
jgi:DNA-binding response OmpR family regulator